MLRSNVTQQVAVNSEGWRRRVAQCVFDMGWTKAKANTLKKYRYLKTYRLGVTQGHWKLHRQ